MKYLALIILLLSVSCKKEEVAEVEQTECEKASYVIMQNWPEECCEELGFATYTIKINEEDSVLFAAIGDGSHPLSDLIYYNKKSLYNRRHNNTPFTFNFRFVKFDITNPNIVLDSSSGGGWMRYRVHDTTGIFIKDVYNLVESCDHYYLTYP